MHGKRGSMQVCALLCALALLLPSVALAGAADESLAIARTGAEFFKAGQYLEAAQAFERAWQLDATDPRNLRYAGRAWQEIGHLQRARLLLERYVEVETHAEHKASIADKLEPLRRVTPQQVADALVVATQKYPAARLEADAALALEKVGDEPALRRSLKFWEVARLGAVTPTDRDAVEAAITRVQARLLDLEQKRLQAKAEPPPQPKVEPKPVPKAEPKVDVKPEAKAGQGPVAGVHVGPKPEPPGAPIALYATGGAALLGGVALWLVGYQGGLDANAKAEAGDFGDGPAGHQKYLDEKRPSDVMYWGGIGAAAVGAGLLAWAFVDGGPAEGKRAADLRLLPTATGEAAGLAAVGRF